MKSKFMNTIYTQLFQDIAFFQESNPRLYGFHANVELTEQSCLASLDYKIIPIK